MYHKMDESMKFRVNYMTWGCLPATTTVSAKSFADARQVFYSTEHGINTMRIDSIEKV